MVKSGLIFGIVALLLFIGSATIISPLCAPCLGLFLGLGAGYLAGSFDKPANVNESTRKGAIAGAIAGSLGLVGGMIGGVINGLILNPSDLNSIYQLLGVPNPFTSQSNIWTFQLVGGFCIGLFDIAFMAILGLAGGALWYQITGKNQTRTIIPPQEPIPPAV